MVDEPDSENSLFSEPMKMRAPSAPFGAAEQVDHAALGLEVVEQEPHTFEVFQRPQVVEQVGVPAHDQLAVLAPAAGPAGETGCHDLLRQLVELGLALLERLLQLALGFGERAPAHMRVEEVRGLGQRRGRQARPEYR